MAAADSSDACELKNKHGFFRAVVVALFLSAAFPAFAQQPEHPQPGASQQAPGVAGEPTEHGAAEEHGNIWMGLLWPTVNFAILVGVLWYFFKEPVATYLTDRHSAIRKELVEAANVKAAAAAQLAEIDRKLQALPGEIEALRRRGAEEVAAEEARIAGLAAAERERLLEQTRREIELQLRLAKRELVEHAADLSVQLAGDRIQQRMTANDQDRLVDRYLDTIQGDGGASGRPA